MEAITVPPPRLAPHLEEGGVLLGKKLLVVDDDMRTVYALAATPLSATTTSAPLPRSVAALAALDEHPDVAAVMMDMMMPEMDGYEAMSQIRGQARFADLPILAVTAKAMKGDAERCIESGATEYVPKPIDSAALLGILERAILRRT